MASTSSSFLLANLHCPSCITHIDNILSPLEPTSVSASLITSLVTVTHDKSLSSSQIRAALIEGGFDVCDVSPDGSSSKFEDTGYLDRVLQLWNDRNKTKGHGSGQTHLENCESCRLAKHASEKSLPQFDGMAASTVKKDADLPLIVVDSKPSDSDSEIVWRATLAVSGMTCAVCVNAISNGVGKKGWVRNVTVNLVSHSATVDFIGKHHEDEIVDIIDAIGYDATIDSVVDLKELQKVASYSGQRTVEILVEGLHCAECPPRISAALAKFSGLVVEKPLTLKDPMIRITYTPSLPEFTIRTIIESLSELESLKASIYHPPSMEERSRQMQARERSRILIRVLATLTIAIPTFVIGIVYMSLVASSDSGRQFLMQPLRAGVSRTQWALFILATPVFFFCADVFHVRALKELRTMWRRTSTTPLLQRFYRFGSMNMLMSLGTSIAYFSSLAQLIVAASHSGDGTMIDNGVFYFDSVVFLTLFLLTGRLIEAYSKSKTGDAVLMLAKLRPTEALLLDKNQSIDKINVDLLEYGDLVKVLNGASPPCDGFIVEGESTFDESSLTGESKLIGKTIGDPVYSGTVNKNSPVTINITGVAGSSMLDQIVLAVREGQTRRAPMERIADTLTGYFVPFVTFVAISIWLIWLALGYSGTLPASYLEGQSSWVAWSLQFAIAVFVVACPCGLALAAPTALFVGGGLAAQHGILVKGGGEAFEKASRLDCVVFDKTGTLTAGGEPTVTNFEAFSTRSKEDILSMVGSIEANSSHTVAKALVSFCKSEKATFGTTSSEIEELPGLGLQGNFSEDTIIIGNEALIIGKNLVSIPEKARSDLEAWKLQGRSVALAAVKTIDADYELVGIFAIADPIRPEAPAVIKALRERGTDVWMLSGDNQKTAEAIGAEVGIPASNIIAGVLPSQKSEHIRRLQQSQTAGRRTLVAMVGDGINDSPALTTADVGIAIGSGSDIAISSAEFVLIKSDLYSLLTLLDLSKTVFRRIKFNFGWALVYNMVALPVAAGVLYPIVSSGKHVRLDPVWASLAMAASSISVVCSSLALRSRIPGLGFRAKKNN